MGNPRTSGSWQGLGQRPNVSPNVSPDVSFIQKTRMLCLSPFSEDKFHARFFLCPAVPYPAHRAVACSGRAARPSAVSAVFRRGVSAGAHARRARAAVHQRRAADAFGRRAEHADRRTLRARLAVSRHAPGCGIALPARGRIVFGGRRASPVRPDAGRRARVSGRAAAARRLCARSVSAIRLALAGRPPLRAEPRRFHPSGRADPSLVPRRTAA